MKRKRKGKRGEGEQMGESNLRGMCRIVGKHGCVSVLNDASRSERNQFGAGRECRAYNN